MIKVFAKMGAVIVILQYLIVTSGAHGKEGVVSAEIGMIDVRPDMFEGKKIVVRGYLIGGYGWYSLKEADNGSCLKIGKSRRLAVVFGKKIDQKAEKHLVEVKGTFFSKKLSMGESNILDLSQQELYEFGYLTKSKISKIYTSMCHS